MNISELKRSVGARFDRLLITLQPSEIELPSKLFELCGSGESLVDLGCGNGNHWGEF